MEDNLWHLSATCPASITRGAETNSVTLIRDIDQASRTTPGLLGADER